MNDLYVVSWVTRLGTRGMKVVEGEQEAKQFHTDLETLDSIESTEIRPATKEESDLFQSGRGDVIIGKTLHGETIRFSPEIPTGDPLLDMTDIQLFKQYYENVEKLIVDAIKQDSPMPMDQGVKRRLEQLYRIIGVALREELKRSIKPPGSAA